METEKAERIGDWLLTHTGVRVGLDGENFSKQYREYLCNDCGERYLVPIAEAETE